jgi:hypothetical protein
MHIRTNIYRELRSALSDKIKSSPPQALLELSRSNIKSCIAAKVANFACYIRSSSDWFKLRNQTKNYPCKIRIPLTTSTEILDETFSAGLRKDLAQAAMIACERIHVHAERSNDEDTEGVYAHVYVRPRGDAVSPDAHDVTTRIIEACSAPHGALADSLCGRYVDFGAMSSSECHVMTGNSAMEDVRCALEIMQRIAAAEAAGLVRYVLTCACMCLYVRTHSCLCLYIYTCVVCRE